MITTATPDHEDHVPSHGVPLDGDNDCLPVIQIDDRDETGNAITIREWRRDDDEEVRG